MRFPGDVLIVDGERRREKLPARVRPPWNGHTAEQTADVWQADLILPSESLDAPEDLPKQAPCQITFAKLEDEVSGMPDEVSVRLGPCRMERGGKGHAPSER